MAPRDQLEDGTHSLFGRSSSALWREPGSVEDQVVLRAAKIQHQAAMNLVSSLKARGVTIGEFADRQHINAEGQRRKLRGESWASLQDIARWQLETDEK